jgi:hypothetical protein
MIAGWLVVVRSRALNLRPAQFQIPFEMGEGRCAAREMIYGDNVGLELVHLREPLEGILQLGCALAHAHFELLVGFNELRFASSKASRN